MSPPADVTAGPWRVTPTADSHFAWLRTTFAIDRTFLAFAALADRTRRSPAIWVGGALLVIGVVAFVDMKRDWNRVFL